MNNTQPFEATILLVDDDVDLLELIKETIEDDFSSVLTTDRATAALELIKSKKIDCVVTDYRMPEMSGLALIEYITQNHPEIPIILLTSNGSDPEVINAIETGLFDYVSKPFKAPVLLNRIRNALLLPRLESLIYDLAKTVAPDVSIDGTLTGSYQEKLETFLKIEKQIKPRISLKK